MKRVPGMDYFDKYFKDQDQKIREFFRANPRNLFCGEKEKEEPFIVPDYWGKIKIQGEKYILYKYKNSDWMLSKKITRRVDNNTFITESGITIYLIVNGGIPVEESKEIYNAFFSHLFN